MSLNNLRPPRGAKHPKKRVGRGPGSGHGKTASRGSKGAQSRSGFRFKRGFEGGQMPLHRRVPKRGFHNPFRVEYVVVNLDTLTEVFDAGTSVTPELLRERGIVRETNARIKVLGRGECGKALTVRAHKFSESATKKIAAAGGVAEVLSYVLEIPMDSLRNIFAIPELRKRVLFTFGILAAYRVGGHINTPGINIQALNELTKQAASSNLFGLYDMFSGYNLSQMTVFALGVMPYISASIILQLLTVVWPYLERLSKEGELGRRKITQYTRYGTIVLSVVQSLAIAVYLENAGQAGGFAIVDNPGLGFKLMTVLTLSTGSVLVMWLGEQITERGIGNGMSLLIYAGIVVGLPRGAMRTLTQLSTGEVGPIRLVLLVALMVAVVGAVVFVERGHRRVTVQYARRMVGRRMYGGASTHIPLKVNTGGVMPVIFASSILAFPQTMKPMFPSTGFMSQAITQLSIGYPLYNLFYVGLIIFFAYFYTAIIFNPDDVAENMRKYGGFVPGIRPGKRTAEHIDGILARVTLAGALYLAAIALLPELLLTGFKVAPIPLIGDRLDAILPRFITEGMNVQFYFGGTSLLIIVGVAMDTVQQVESQLIMRHYDGFMKKTRIRGRRG